MSCELFCFSGDLVNPAFSKLLFGLSVIFPAVLLYVIGTPGVRGRFKRDMPYKGFFAHRHEDSPVSVRLRYTGPVSRTGARRSDNWIHLVAIHGGTI